ncbi:MAG: class I SAM-dependent rRNA methyltransferase [Erysipelotrichaceae bacterium]|uniref:class I SAM-dependent rRNA methyltransferase n=1 Tax=Floccifex sp. TaxID=2815810 RepID=UPI002A76339A|nr:class I SAM-dependent rRNA methyltransferase [Floccifex sp.]MDD7281170.1 class I SAM-dependent rRNA methyltransferase [Erysipelotrichaceae bacterium]MDY2958804.1 class I SAM-dependent rRNA methyltransferase [Floccifex sp.]
MKTIRQYPIIQITKKGKKFLQEGHPWVYEGEVVDVINNPEDGQLVDVMANNTYMGTGFYNSHSKIRVRLISRNANDTFDENFWYRRAKYAIQYRQTVMPDEDFKCCRLVHGEADQFPGLTIDRFNTLLSVQFVCLGMDKIKDVILKAFYDILTEMGENIEGIYLRNDVSIRKLEGMEEYKGWYEGISHPDSALVEIIENGIIYQVDVENGQKTGFFLDQKYNRKAIRRISKDKTILDCFTHTGSFGLNAAKGEAKHVTSVDISSSAIEMARENARRNHLDNISFEVCDVFDLLTQLDKEKKHPYDFIILDPPAFTKSRNTIKDATRGYKEINYRAMKILPRGGYLATCSCSHFMSDELFRKMLADAAKDANVALRQIEARQQACDHPILWNVDETNYLKFYIFQVC